MYEENRNYSAVEVILPNMILDLIWYNYNYISFRQWIEAHSKLPPSIDRWWF